MSSAQSPNGLPEFTLEGAEALSVPEAMAHEWLFTNGLGGYASGTVALCNTRKYHGLFIPSVPGHGRMVMLARMEESFDLGGAWIRLDGEEEANEAVRCPGVSRLTSFRLKGLVPEWNFDLGEGQLRRQLVLVHGENTLYVVYSHLGGTDLKFRLRPYPSFRGHEEKLAHGEDTPSVLITDGRVELRARPDALAVKVRFHSSGDTPFTALEKRSPPLCYRIEKARGYEDVETLRSPGFFECRLKAGEVFALCATTDGWDRLERAPKELLEMEFQREQRILERAPVGARTGTAARLVLSADQFLIEPSNRPQDEAWARATGQDARSVIAGYHWFTDWGRDTMISLEGLTLVTGRQREAAAILRTFQHYVRDGLIPNFFPDGQHHGVYHTADATLWYFHAIGRYLAATGDHGLLRDIFPTLESIISHHVKGTRFNIHRDEQDGLLVQGEEGYQLTWMDAKVDGWVVTPRRGKAVEINALWFNALSLMGEWSHALGKDPGAYEGMAKAAQTSFNQRFWNAAEGCLFDVVDREGGGDDAAVRPNQIFSISLENPVLDPARWAPVLQKVRDELLTPVGLRTLSPKSPDYKSKYDGDLRSRDAAYHQGTVWPWLLGHFVDAWMKHQPDKSIGRGLLLGLEKHLGQSCLGQVSEVFDASDPFRPRGCVAQAWSVAEMLRVWVRTG